MADSKIEVVGTSRDGKKHLYSINPETGTCKKVASSLLDKWTEPEDISGLDEKSARINTRILHDILKEKGLQVSFTGSRKDLRVKCQGYEFQYTTFGFECRDTFRSYERVNISPVNEDMPGPDSVIRFLKNAAERPIAAPTGEITVLEATERLRMNESTGIVEVVNKAHVSHERESMEDLLDRVFEEWRTKQITQKEANLEIQKALGKEETSKKNRIGRAFKSSANRKLIEKEVRGIIAADVKVKAPKFEFYDFPLERLVDVIDLEADERVLYKWESDERKRTVITKSLAYHQFYWRAALHLYPAAMPLFMQIATGAVKYNSFKPPHNYMVKDAYQFFDKKVLDDSPNTVAIVQLAQDILSWFQEIDPFDVLYSKDYKKGDKVQVYWTDYAMWFTGEVVSNDFGVLIRYEDGAAVKLCRHQRVRVQGE